MLRALKCVFVAVLTASSLLAMASPGNVSFSSPEPQVDRYGFVEITASIQSPDAANPFEDATLTGVVETVDGAHRRQVEGFCDSMDGSTFRIRFMAPEAAEYKYTVTYKQGSFQKTSQGTFRAVEAHKRGILRVDPDYPWHFIWEGTGEHYFFNGTTAYWLVGWRDERVIQYSVDRLHRLKVNRLRVTIAGREAITFFGEPVMTGSNWTALIAAWPAQNADDPFHPGFDYGRFNLPYWQKFERMLEFARDRDMIISLVLDMNDGRVHPAAGSEDERRFIRYAIDRFGAFSNITWDMGDDLDSYRDEKWTHDTGMFIQHEDPYKHLETSHPAVSNDHQDRASSWFGFTSYQEWSRNQHALMLASRKLQEKTGRIIPQTNEEYGYEDHYPHWAAPGSDSADVLRRTAWDISMAGAYGTAGESARRGTNIWPDSGGGWLNGRGDDTQTMFLGYGHMVDFFTSFEWWKTSPHDELVSGGNYCLADRGKTYAIYLPHGGSVTIQLQPGRYRASWFSAISGETIDLPPVVGSEWKSPDAPDQNDWALLLRAM
jgi:Protein of unknown function (DUF4038)/Domain of unknown function (DUF5060)/Putative collagen-binding domain of a collagenase